MMKTHLVIWLIAGALVFGVGLASRYDREARLAALSPDVRATVEHVNRVAAEAEARERVNGHPVAVQRVEQDVKLYVGSRYYARVIRFTVPGNPPLDCVKMTGGLQCRVAAP